MSPRRDFPERKGRRGYSWKRILAAIFVPLVRLGFELRFGPAVLVIVGVPYLLGLIR